MPKSQIARNLNDNELYQYFTYNFLLRKHQDGNWVVKKIDGDKLNPFSLRIDQVITSVNDVCIEEYDDMQLHRFLISMNPSDIKMITGSYFNGTKNEQIQLFKVKDLFVYKLFKDFFGEW